MLFGVVLIAFLVCTFTTLERFIRENELGQLGSDLDRTERWKQERRIATKSKVVAALVVAAAFWIQNEYRHRYAPEAQARIQFDKLLDRWERGDREAVIDALDSLAEARPWKASHDEYESP